MGIYDNNLKRTNLGYQFDRNVYIGIQTNDNRVVTFKDLSGAVATQIASGGGGEDIQLQLSSITELGSSTNPADHLSFHRDGLPVEYDILPQYVRAAEPEEGLDLNDGKACLLMPVVGDNDEIIGYKLYATDTLSMATLQLVIGSNTYTYDGSAAVEINFGTIPTVAASSRNIITEIPDSDSSTDIPTAGAVHKFAASAGSLNMTAATSGYLVGVVQQPSATTQTLAPVGSESIKWGTAASYVGSASQWLNANITGHLNNDFVISIGGTTYSYNGSDATTVNLGTIPTVAASSVAIVTDISTTSGAASSTAIPTEGAVYKFAAAAGSVKATASASGYILGTANGVTATETSGAGALNPVGTNSLKWSTDVSTLPTVSHWINANITGRLNNNFVINIGGTTYSYNGGAAETINLSTIPTVSASSVGITTSISSASSTNIPTEGAVYQFAASAGSLKLTEATTGYLVGVGQQPTTTTQTLAPVGSGSIKWGASASYVGTASQWLNANITGQLNNSFIVTVGGTTYSYNGSEAETINFNTVPTVAASSVGITTSVSSSSSSQIPTEGAVYDAIQRLAPGIGGIATSGTGNAVTELSYNSTTKTLTVTSGTTFLTGVTGSGAISVTGTGASRTISLNASFTSPSLTWGTATTYATVNGTTYSITLPTVNTIPTVAASSMGVVTTVSASASDSEIPTAKAVWSVANAAGKVKEIQVNGVTQTISSAGVVNLPAIPATLDNLPDGSTRKLSNYLPKTTYEYNQEIAFGSTGYLKIGRFPVYDSNITIQINSTDSNTYHATVVIATQNVSTSYIGSAHNVHVYGDERDAVTNALRVVYVAASRAYDVYFIPNAWSKNLIHIQANALAAAPSDICLNLSGTPPTTTSGLEPVNILKSTYAQKSAFSYNSTTGVLTISLD